MAPFPHLAPYAWFGWIGVQIFFAISGFVIAMTAQNRTASQFLGARFLRLMPAIWICATVTLIANSLVDHWSMDYFKQYFRSMTLEPFHPWVGWIDSVYWTLTVEIAFYAAIFLLLLLNLHRALGVFAIVLGLTSVIRIFAPVLIPDLQLFFGPADQLAYYGCYFATGMLIWQCAFKKTTPQAIVVIMLCLAAATLEIAEHTQQAYFGRPGVSGPLAPILAFYLSLAAIVASVIFRDDIERFAGRYAGVPRVLGLISFPLYLLHYRVGMAIMAFFNRAGFAPAFGLIAAVLLSFAGAYFIAMIWEPEVRADIRRIKFPRYNFSLLAKFSPRGAGGVSGE